MTETHDSLLGVGIYSVAEAARLTRVSPWRIRRWVSGYSFMSQGEQHSSPPVWQGDIPRIEGGTALSFRDLLEIRAIDVFLEAGVSWKALRRAEKLGRKLLDTTHPFSTNRIRTDGRQLFAEIYEEDREPTLMDLIDSQRVFRAFVSPYLRDLSFSDAGVPICWWPYQQSRRIVIDPQRSFGQPIVRREGVPTRVLASAFNTMQSESKVAHWYGVATAAVGAAVGYEGTLLAA